MILWQPEPVTRDLDRMVHYAGLWGVDGLELRTVGKHAQRIPDVNEAPLRKRIEDEEVDIMLSATDVFSGHVEDVAAWMNDLLRFSDILAFNRRLGIGASVVESMDGDGPIPDEPYRRLVDLAVTAGQTVLVPDPEDDDRVPSLVSAVDHPGFRRTVTRPLDPGSWNGNASDIGLVRCRCVVQDLVDQDTVQQSWTVFLKAMRAQGFSGDVLLEFGGAETGKNGLRLATAFIRATRAAFKK